MVGRTRWCDRGFGSCCCSLDPRRALSYMKGMFFVSHRRFGWITDALGDRYVFVVVRIVLRNTCGLTGRDTHAQNRAFNQSMAIMSQLVFEHTLRMRVKAEPSHAKTLSTKDEEKKSTHLVGRMTNLVTSDLNDLTDGRDFPLSLVSFPMHLVGCTWFLYNILGWRFVPRTIPVFEPFLISSVHSAIVGMMVIVMLSPVPRYLAAKLQIIQRGKAKKVSCARLSPPIVMQLIVWNPVQTDARVQAVTEVMNVIRMIKMFGWENRMDDRVAKLREEELEYQRRRLLLQAISTIVKYGSLSLVLKMACLLTALSAFPSQFLRWLFRSHAT